MNSFHEHVREGLSRLRTADPSGQLVLGATSHHYLLEAPIQERTVATFERKHKIKFHSDYREFIICLGNGGAGPASGVFRLGEMDVGCGQTAWSTTDRIVGDLSAHFAHQQPWNLSAEELARIDANDIALLLDYWSATDGAIPICRGYDGDVNWLVVSGAEAGRVWHDATTNFGGWSPVIDGSGQHTSFADWYSAWLEQSLATVDCRSHLLRARATASTPHYSSHSPDRRRQSSCSEATRAT